MTNIVPSNLSTDDKPLLIDADLIPIDLDVEELHALAKIKSSINEQSPEEAESSKSISTIQIFEPKISKTVIVEQEKHTPNLTQSNTNITSPIQNSVTISESVPIEHHVSPIAANTPAVDAVPIIDFALPSQIAYPNSNIANSSEAVFVTSKSITEKEDKFADEPILISTQLEEPLTVGRRLMDMLLVGLIFALIGLLIDWLVNIVKAVGNTGNESIWFFVYFMGILGMILGYLTGTKALDAVFGLFRTTPTENNPSNDDDSFSSGIMKAIGFGLLLGIIGWFIMMLMV